VRRIARAALLALPILLGAAGNDADVIAQRGSVRLTLGDVRAMLDAADPAARAQVEANPTALAALVREKLLQQSLLADAHANGWDARPEVQQRANDARDAAIVESYLASLVPADPAYPTDAQIAAAYESNKSRLMLPRQYHLAQVAVLIPANATPDAVEAARRHAADLRRQLAKPRADFAEIARTASQDKTSAANGGDLGWVRDDQIQPAIRDAVSGLPDGGLSDPVRTQDAWHIIKLVETRPAGPAPLDQVRPQLVAALRKARTEQLTRAAIDAMLRKEPIQLNEIDLARRLATPH
jgi:peptidylprolyl isomerase